VICGNLIVSSKTQQELPSVFAKSKKKEQLE